MAHEKYQGKHDVRTMEKRGERMAHGHIAHAFQKIWLYLLPRLVVAGASNRPCGFVCVLFCGMRLLFHVIPFVVVVVRVVVIGI